MLDFQITKERMPDGVAFLKVSGFLDAHTYEQLEKALTELFDSGIYRIGIDLSKMNYISSAGAGVFIGAIGTVQDKGGRLILLNPTTNVKEVFELLGLDQIFTFADTRESTLKALRA